MAGNANRNVGVDITGDSSSLERAYDRASKKSDDMAKKQEDDAKKSDNVFKFLAKGVATSFDALFDVIGMIGKLGPANIALIAVALAALGPASVLAAGSITLGLGGALLGLGITAAAQSGVVKAEFAKLAEDIKSEMSDAAEPLERSLLRVPDTARNVFGQFKPALSDAFASLSPVFDQFVRDMGNGLAQFVPAIEPIQKGFSALLTSIGIEAPTIFGNLASAFTTLANTASEHADDVAGLLTMVTGFVDGTATVLSNIADAWDKSMGVIESGISGVGGGLLGWQPDLDNSDLKWQSLSQTLITSAAKLNENKMVMDDLTVSTDTLKLAINGLNNEHLNGDMALSAYEETLIKTREQVEKNWGAITLFTESGRENYDQIFALVRASQALILARSEEGATVGELRDLYEEHRQKLADVGKRMGMNADDAKALADRYLSIPKDIETKITADTSGAQNAVDNFITLNSGRQIPIDVYNRNSQLKDGGLAGRDGYATGGHVRGPGGSRTDSIPTRVSRGEYIVNAAATRRNLPLLEAINSSNRGMGGMGTTIVYNISTSVAPTANLAAVGGAVVEAIQSYEQRSGRSWRSN